MDKAGDEILAGLRCKSQSELQVTTFVGNGEFLRSITPDKIGFLGIEISQLSQSNLPLVSISVKELKDHEVHAMMQGKQTKETPQPSCVHLPVIKKNLATSQTRSSGDSFPSLNRSGRNTEKHVIDLTHDGLNTSVSVEESDFLEKFMDFDVPEDSSLEVNSINDQDKENTSPGAQHRPNSPVYGKLIKA